MKTMDYYNTLGISKSATDDDIKRAYRALAKKYHPDANQDNKEQATEKFKEISEAYEVLMDKNKRSTYDRFGYDGLKGSFGSGGFNMNRDFTHFEDLGDIFEGLFGGGGLGGGSIFDLFTGGGRNGFRQREGSRVIKGGDIRVNMKLSLKEVANGVGKKIKLKRYEKCDMCGGSGAKKGSGVVTCPECQGRGQVARTSRGLLGGMVQTI